MSYEFDDAITLDADGRADLPERWTMGPGFAHGGYLMSLALAAATLDAPRPDPISMSAHFMRPGKVGSAEVNTEVLKAGRQLGTVAVDVTQNGSVDVATITTFGDLSDADDVGYRSTPFPDLPAPSLCIPASREENPLIPRMVDNLDLRLTPKSTSWAKGIQLDEATMEGWVRFADDRPIDCVSIPMFADALPPPIFSLGDFAPWTPTVEMTVHFRRRPTTDWLAVSFCTALVGGQFFESSGTLWDESRNLVAMSRQIQLVNR